MDGTLCVLVAAMLIGYVVGFGRGYWQAMQSHKTWADRLEAQADNDEE